jgi:hypothetical protein
VRDPRPNSPTAPVPCSSNWARPKGGPFFGGNLQVGERERSSEYEHGQAQPDDSISPAAECLFHDEVPLQSHWGSYHRSIGLEGEILTRQLVREVSDILGFAEQQHNSADAGKPQRADGN